MSVNKTNHALRLIVIYQANSVIYLFNNPALYYKNTQITVATVFFFFAKIY